MAGSIAQDRPETARLRTRNQITLPERVAARLQATPGDRFMVLVEGPDSVRLVRIRESYAGALPGLWGPTQADADRWLRDERRAWRQREQRYDPGGSADG